MKDTAHKTAMLGPRRFQWQVGGWFGSVFGGSAWLIPAAAILAFHGQTGLALVPALACLGINVLGAALWYRRDRVRPFPALVGILGVFAFVTPLVWFTISANATPASLAAMNWPQQGITGVMVVLICPIIIAWLSILEYSDNRGRTLRRS